MREIQSLVYKDVEQNVDKNLRLNKISLQWNIKPYSHLMASNITFQVVLDVVKMQ